MLYAWVMDGRLYSLAIKAGKLMTKPPIALLREDNARQGFFEPEHLRDVLKHLPEELRPVVKFAYITGWRVKSEVLTREWRHVDLKAGEVRLEPGTVANGRRGPLRPKPIKSFSKAFARACREAGCPWRILHDFRRTAVRNLELAGVPRSVAMKLTGHLTESVYRRYAIADQRDLRVAVEKLDAIASVR